MYDITRLISKGKFRKKVSSIHTNSILCTKATCFVYLIKIENELYMLFIFTKSKRKDRKIAATEGYVCKVKGIIVNHQGELNWFFVVICFFYSCTADTMEKTFFIKGNLMNTHSNYDTAEKKTVQQQRCNSNAIK